MFKKIAVSVLLTLIMISYSQATTYYVNATNGSNSNNGLSPGNAFLTSGKICSTVVAGDTAYYLNGTFDERWLAYDGRYACLFPVNNGVSHNSNIVFYVHPESTVVVKGDTTTGNEGWGVLLSTRQYIVINGFEVCYSYPAGIGGWSQNYNRIKNCHVHHNRAANNDNGGGIYIGYDASSYCVVESCIIDSNYSNLAVDVNFSGIHTYRTYACTLKYNTIFSHRPYGNGIRLKREDSLNVIYGNIIYDNDVGMGVGSGSRANRFHHNLIYKCNDGFRVWLSGDIPHSDSNMVYNNTFDSCAVTGIHLYDHSVIHSEYDSIFNNIFSNIDYDNNSTEEGIHWRQNLDGESTYNGLYSDYNCVYNANNSYFGSIYGGNNAGTYTLNNWTSTFSIDVNSICQSPLYEPGNHTYILSDSSPCRTTGRGGAYPTYMGAIDPEAEPPDPPATPTLASPANGATNLSQPVVLNWNNVATATYYHVQIDNNSDFGSPEIDNGSATSSQYNASGLEGSTRYYWRVQAGNSGGTSSWSSSRYFTTAAPDEDDPVISNVNSGNITSNSAAITWTTDEPATSQIDYGFTSSYGLSTTVDPSLITNHEVILTGLQRDNDYHFRVRSADASDNEAVSGDYTFHTDTSTVVENIAPASDVTVSSTYSGYSSIRINDGVINPRGGTPTTWASTESSSSPHWIEFDFGSNKSLESISINWAWNDYRSEFMTSQQYYIQRWNGSDYTTFNQVDNSSADSVTTTDVSGLTTSRLRIYQPANMGSPNYSSVIWLTEVEIYGSDAESDTIPPAPIDDLNAIPGENHGDIILTWTAPSDGDIAAYLYEIKYSIDPISESNWESAISVSDAPAPQSSGTNSTFVMEDLEEGQPYYVGIKSYDGSGNASDLSNTPDTFACGIMPPSQLSTEVDSTNGSVVLTSSCVESYRSVSYKFTLDSLSDFPSPKIGLGFGAGDDTITMVTFNELSSDINYFWRCCAYSAASPIDSLDADSSGWSPTINFNLISGAFEALTESNCLYPAEGDVVHASQPVFSIRNATGIEIIYFQIADNDQFDTFVEESGPVQKVSGSDITTWKLSESLEQGETYYWRISPDNILWAQSLSFSTLFDIHPYPNPFRPSDGHTAITFTNLPQNSNIIIATISGEIVMTGNDIGPDDWVWDARNSGGDNLASGVYLYMVDFPSGSTNGKVIVIR
ncbi:MAG: right-handed parallel beta-helix repeat-containing protein [candidate division Zixibacteria bacterium]|nr:right-handed parallel beta-helix repeat-containing protein [candidate division Zixibacteria bacterium]